MRVAKYISSSSLADNICPAIGFSHNPYTWIENHCEAMMEDHNGKL